MIFWFCFHRSSLPSEKSLDVEFCTNCTLGFIPVTSEDPHGLTECPLLSYSACDFLLPTASMKKPPLLLSLQENLTTVSGTAVSISHGLPPFPPLLRQGMSQRRDAHHRSLQFTPHRVTGGLGRSPFSQHHAVHSATWAQK